MAKDDDLLPKKRVKTGPVSKGTGSSKASSGPSASMLRLIRIVRGIAWLLGGFVSLVFLMAFVGKITDSFLVRFLVSLVLVIGLPALAADRLLKKASGGLGLVADVFAIVLLGISLIVVGAEFATKDMLLKEGDRYARSGSRGMARVVYFIAGVNPVFPNEKAAVPPQPAGSTTPDAGVK